MSGFVKGFVFPPYWKYNEEDINKVEYEGDREQFLRMPCACPLSIKLSSKSDKDWWEFPLEPIIAINGKNNIIKRNVLKVLDGDTGRRGSVKELWSQDDYEINISGVFHSYNGELPDKEMRKLRQICEARETIDVKSSLFVLFDITRIAVEDFQFPFTKGITNQIFTIKAVSDDFSIDKLLVRE